MATTITMTPAMMTTMDFLSDEDHDEVLVADTELPELVENKLDDSKSNIILHEKGEIISQRLSQR